MYLEPNSSEGTQTIIARFREYSFEDLHPLFKVGKTPLFKEIEGDTVGSFLALNPKTGLWRKLALKVFFDSPLARWKGKRFITPFDEEKRGKGVNLFRNRILPQRFPIDTYISKSLFDENPCLFVIYPRFPSRMFGLVDQLRRIDNGVFLGQGHHKLPWRKEHSLQGYFILCASTKSD